MKVIYGKAQKLDIGKANTKTKAEARGKDKPKTKTSIKKTNNWQIEVKEFEENGCLVNVD